MSDQAHQKPVRFSIVGIGNMGRTHIQHLVGMEDAELVAVCDVVESRARAGGEAGSCDWFTDVSRMFEKAKPDAVLVSTPHYDHVPIAIEALEQGIHVLVEKPLSVEGTEARRAIAAYETARRTFPSLQFGAMFNQRTYGHWKKIKDLVDSGELGKLVRATWIITDWFRTQHYYDTGGWRATWAGEGGGVLLNQCPHNLDLYQWFFGMPQRVRGFASLGKYHQIEVEDEVTAYFEHGNGMVGHFITSTGESPGTNRLEIVGERGRLVYESNVIRFDRNRESMLTTIAESPLSFTKTEHWPATVPFSHHGEGGHRLLTEQFVDAIQGRAQVVAEAPEGLNSVLLGNAIMLSSFESKTVEMPMDEHAYAQRLAELRSTSKYDPSQDNGAKAPEDLAGSH